MTGLFLLGCTWVHLMLGTATVAQSPTVTLRLAPKPYRAYTYATEVHFVWPKSDWKVAFRLTEVAAQRKQNTSRFAQPADFSPFELTADGLAFGGREQFAGPEYDPTIRQKFNVNNWQLYTISGFPRTLNAPDVNLGEFLGEMLEGLGTLTPVVPGHPVRVGATWNGELLLGSAFFLPPYYSKLGLVPMVRAKLTDLQDVGGKKTATISEDAEEDIRLNWMVRRPSDVVVNNTITKHDYENLHVKFHCEFKLGAADGMPLSAHSQTTLKGAGFEMVVTVQMKRTRPGIPYRQW